jgi:transcriptional regulator with XRE-family HTH domain
MPDELITTAKKGRMTENTVPFSPARLATIRKERGLTQRGLALAAGVSQALVAELESGKHPPSNASLAKIAQALGTETASFIERHSQSKTSP